MTNLYPVQPAWRSNAHFGQETYKQWYRESIEDPDKFWGYHGKRLHWFKPYSTVKNASFDSPVNVKWFEDGELNASYNCIDRHLPTRADQPALIWESDSPYLNKTVTYRELKERTCRLANVLKSHGVKKGDTVTIYLPMILEAVYAMLACARIGALHSVVFGGFSADSLSSRLVNAGSRFVITADEGPRGGKIIPLKVNVDAAIALAAERGTTVETVLVVQRTGGNVEWNSARDIWYHEACSAVSADCDALPMKAEDPLFLLYTSGSTGQPKGILHTTGGYLLHTSLTHQYVFNHHEGDVLWCTADVGWITGHSYAVYGPLCNGGTSVIYEGVPTFPNASRYWETIDKHTVTSFYTAPTVLRSLMGSGSKPLETSTRQSLKLLGSVGESINPEAWLWYFESVGKSKLPIIDTWFQTETGGIMMTPLPGVTDLKPGSAAVPFFGVNPQLLSVDGTVLTGAAQGNLCISDSWPGQMRTIQGDQQRFEQTYFSAFPGKYFTGDGCKRDDDGYYWITGRVDDVINVSGHRIGTAEIESSLGSHPQVAEAAAVGFAHAIKGQAIHCYVTLASGIEPSDSLRKDLLLHVRTQIGAFATPDRLQFTTALPKTRSGKIMRRILRKIADDDVSDLGDLSTLSDPSVLEELVASRTAKEPSR